jgi:hypothetical protein
MTFILPLATRAKKLRLRIGDQDVSIHAERMDITLKIGA